MKVYVDLTDNELRALRSAIWNGIGACSGSCIYTEMQTKKTECGNCAYVKALDSLREKFSKPKSLTDYTQQVRKEVIQELKNKMLYCSERILKDGHYYNGKELDEIVDQLQRENK